MRKATLLSLLLLLLLAGQGWGATGIETIARWDFQSSWVDSAGAWGHTGSRAVKKINITTGAIETIQTTPANFNNFDLDGDGTATEDFNILGVFGTNDSSVYLCVIQCIDADDNPNILNKNFVVRSTDGGVTWSTTEVLMLGCTDCTNNGVDGTYANQETNCTILTNRSYCLATVALPGGTGIGNIYIAEYNSAPGVSREQRIWQSTNDGATFTEVVKFNVDEHDIDHFHCIKQDPDTGYIYVVTGDHDAEISMWRWDGVAAITDDVDPAAIVESAGLVVVSGDYQYKPIDILFDDTYLYAFTDVNSTDNDDDGIWRADKDDLENWTNQLTAVPDTTRTGWLGFKVGDNLFWSDNPTPSTDGALVNFYSYDSGTWTTVATFGMKSGQAAPANIANNMEYGGYAYLSANYADAADASNYITIKVQTTGEHTDYQPRILFPVVWVSSLGTNDASHGEASGAGAWATLEYALEGTRICRGTSINVAAGTYTQGGIVCDWDGAAAYSDAPTIVYGSGKTTTINSKSNDATTNMLTHAAAEGKLIIKDTKWISTDTDDVAEMLVGAAADLELQDSIVVALDGDVQGMYASGGTITLRDCWIDGDVGKYNGYIADAAGNLYIYNSILSGGVTASISANLEGSKVTMFNDTLVGYDAIGLLTANGITGANLFVKNCVFDGDALSTPIDDDAAIEESATNYDYNSYDATLTDVATGGTHSITSTPPWWNAAAEDYRIRGGWKGIGMGTTDPDGDGTANTITGINGVTALSGCVTPGAYQGRLHVYPFGIRRWWCPE